MTGTRRVRQSLGSKARDAVERLGKSCEQAVDDVEASGGSMRLDDLAAKLGVKRARDLTRRVNPKTGKGRDGFVTKLVSVGVFEVHGDTVTLANEWLEALNEERDRSGEIELFRRDMAQYNREREGYRNRRRVANVVADGNVEDLQSLDNPAPDAGLESEPSRTKNLSRLAAAVRDYLDRSPHDARRSPYWIGVTLWAHDLFEGKPTPEETRAAIEVLGGPKYLDETLKRAKSAA